jgi:hypothetical protein
MMNHQKVLEKKRARLHKYTGKALKNKTAAYERAVQQFNRENPPTLKSVQEVESAVPAYRITLRDGTAFSVRAMNDREARKIAREELKLPRSLPPGTLVERTQ